MYDAIAAAIRNNTISQNIQFTCEACCNCGIPFYMPTYRVTELRKTGESFYCPNGHGQHYSQGKTEAQRLKEQLEQTKAAALLKERELQDKWLDELSKSLKLQRQLKRVHKGVCPCCNRTVLNLKKHMESKHPDLAGKKPVAAIHSKINGKK